MHYESHLQVSWSEQPDHQALIWFHPLRVVTWEMRFSAVARNCLWSVKWLVSRSRIPNSIWRRIHSAASLSRVSRRSTLSINDFGGDSTRSGWVWLVVTAARIWSIFYCKERNSLQVTAAFFFFFYLGLEVECWEPLDSSSSKIMKNSSSSGVGCRKSSSAMSSRPNIGPELSWTALLSTFDP